MIIGRHRHRNPLFIYSRHPVMGCLPGEWFLPHILCPKPCNPFKETPVPGLTATRKVEFSINPIECHPGEKSVVYSRRLTTASLLGVLAGVVCFSGARLLFGIHIPVTNFMFILVSRTLIGFVIGISALRIHWALHGLLMGLVIGLPFPIYDLIIGQSPLVIFMAFIMGPLFGLMIEFLTTSVFKAPMM